MNTLGNMAMGLMLGDGAVAAYLNIARCKNCGCGLFQQTTNKSYRVMNTKNNYPRTASYYNIQKKLNETPMPMKRFFNGNLVSAYNVDGMDIGWAYTTDINKNKLSRGYTSSADFDEFQRLLREDSVDITDARNFTFKRYGKKINEPVEYLAGDFGRDFYESEKVDKKYRWSKDLESISERHINYLQNWNRYIDTHLRKPEDRLFSISTPKIYKIPKINNWEKLSQLNKTSDLNISYEKDYEIKKAKYFNKRAEEFYTESPSINGNLNIHAWRNKDNQVINEVVKQFGNLNPSRGSKATIEGRFLEDIGDDLYNEKKNDNENLKNFLQSGITGIGLLEYYRNDLITNINHRKNYNLYSPQKQYTQNGLEGNKYDTYSVNDENIYYGSNIINDNDGALSVYQESTKRRLYNYYEEPDGKEKNVSKFEGVNIPNTSVVEIGAFGVSNTSKLLTRTNELFKKGKINTLINRFHTEKVGYSELITAHDLTYGISRGRNLLRENPQTDNYKDSSYDNPYCRVWTAHHQYSRLKDRIRPFTDISTDDLQNKLGEGMRPNKQSLNENSVLQDNGFVRISPTREGGTFNNIQKYMFSIENLAWKDVSKENILTKEQIGPNNGRIMWFPPYNLKFSENVSVNWNGNSFIGRGEQIYTYTNTERSGTLDFTILIDHPSILNKWRNKSGEDYSGTILKDQEEEMLRFFAGCGQLDFSPVNIPQKDENKPIDPNPDGIDPKPTSKKHEIAYVIFFPNNYSGFDKKDVSEGLKELYTYEMTSTGANFTYASDESYKNQYLQPENRVNKSNFGINKSGNSYNNKIKEILLGNDDKVILHYLNEMINSSANPIINNVDTGDKLFGFYKKGVNLSNIKYYGFASSHGKGNLNNELANRRLNFIKRFVNKYCTFITNETHVSEPVTRVIDVNNEDVNSFDAKVARAAIVIFEIEEKVDSIPTYTSDSNSVNGVVLDKVEYTENKSDNKEYNSTITEDNKTLATYGDEYLYFSKIGEDDYMVKSIVNRIKHFDPAFHSITPEGFNARLTFLHQCTRQGPTTAVNGGNVSSNSKDYLTYAGNLAFGRAPYCILRIGDFFHTKILIDSMSISYDNNGIQWDLNPEGAGVQPMMANISLNFKFVGGQDLSGPIERLQNAVSSNYYANASVYDKLADYGDVRKDVMRGKIN